MCPQGSGLAMRNRRRMIFLGMAATLLAVTGAAAGRGAAGSPADAAPCLVLRDVPYYQIRPEGAAPTNDERFFPARPPLRDPCALRLFR
jgi:hypothetical protein